MFNDSLDFEVILLTPKNVKKHSQNVAEIYRKGYFYNEKLKKGFYPHNFVYSKSDVESAIIQNPSSLIWSYIKKENVPICAIIGYCENSELELMGLVNIPSIRKKGYYSELMKQYLSDSILNYFNNKIERVVAEPQLVSPPVLMHTIFGNASPLGFSPNMRNVKHPSYPNLKRMPLDILCFYPGKNYFYRSNEINSKVFPMVENISKRNNNYVISEIFELSSLISNFMNISSPLVVNPKNISNSNPSIEVFEESNINSLFMQKSQIFKKSNNQFARVISNINDNSSYLDLSNFLEKKGFNSLIESITDVYNNKEMIYTKGAFSPFHQKILFDQGFFPICYTPCGHKGVKDSITLMKLKSFSSNDLKLVQNLSNVNYNSILSMITKYYNSNSRYEDVLKQQIKIRDIVLKNFQ
jgi:hypothetical protein